MRRFIKYALIGLGVLAAAAVVTIVVVITSIDADYYRPFIEKKAKALTGRDLTLGGPLRLRLSTRLAIVASDVRLTNVAWGAYPSILHIDRLEADVGLLPLLRGIVRIERLHVQGSGVFLETDAAGRGNWKHAPEPRRDPALPWKVEIAVDAVSLADARIEFRNGKTARRYRFALARLAAERDAAGGVVLAGSGRFDEKALSLRVAVGSPEGLFAPRARSDLDLAMTLDAASIAASGTIGDIVAARDVDLRVSVKGGDLAAVARDLGWNAPSIGPYELTGRLSGSRRQLGLHDVRFTAGRADSVRVSAKGEVRDVVRRRSAAFDIDARIDRPERLATWLGEAAAWLPPVRVAGRVTQRRGGVDIDRLALTLGRTPLSGRGRLDLDGGVPKISADIHAETVDLSQLPAGKTLPLKTALSRKLKSAEPLNVAWLRTFDADLELDAAAVRLPRGQSLFRPSARLSLQDGQLTLALLQLQLAPQSPPIAGRVIVQARPAGIQASADVAGASIPLADLLAMAESPAKIDGARTQIDISLRSAGLTARALTEALDGDVKVIVGSGRFDSDKVDFGARLLTRLLGMTQPKERRRAELICGALYLPIRDGVVTIDRNLALRTSNVTIVASGIVDLRDQRMELYVYTRATEGLGLEAGKLTNMFKVQGTFAEPAVSINPKGVVKGGVSIGAAVATAGASLLLEALARKATADSDPCATALGLSSAR